MSTSFITCHSKRFNQINNNYDLIAHIDSPLAEDILYRANKGNRQAQITDNPLLGEALLILLYTVYVEVTPSAGGNRWRGGGEHIKQAGDSFIIPVR